MKLVSRVMLGSDGDWQLAMSGAATLVYAGLLRKRLQALRKRMQARLLTSCTVPTNTTHAKSREYSAVNSSCNPA